MDRIGKVGDTTVYADAASVDVAKAYIKSRRGGAKVGGPSAADDKAAAAFKDRYTVVTTRSGFVGSGSWIWTDTVTGDRYDADARPSGRNFWGTDLWVRMVG